MINRISVMLDWVNEEEAGDEWLKAARASTDPARIIIEPLLEGEPGTALELTEQQWEQVLAWARTLPNWDTGPTWAPAPLSGTWLAETSTTPFM